MKRLHAYSISAAACLSGSIAVQGQILYTDLDPDLVCEMDRIYFDLDQDGTDDVWIDRFYSGFFGAQYSAIMAGKENPYVSLATMGAGFWSEPIKPFAYGDIIGSSDFWVNPNPAFGEIMADLSFIGYYSCEDPTVILSSYGEFFDVSNAYMGVRMSIPTGYIYGWIRLSVEYQDPCPLPYHDAFLVTGYEMAVQLTPNTPITAGDLNMCSPPAGLNSEPESTAAKFSWDPVADAELYKLQYRPIGTLDWATKTIYSPKTTRIIKGLDCGTTYEWRLASVCDGVPSSFTEILQVTTGLCRMHEDLPSNDIIIFPNPTTGQVTIFATSYDTILSYRIISLSGAVALESYNIDNEEVIINTAQLPKGVYVVEVITQGEKYIQSLICQ